MTVAVSGSATLSELTCKMAPPLEDEAMRRVEPSGSRMSTKQESAMPETIRSATPCKLVS